MSYPTRQQAVGVARVAVCNVLAFQRNTYAKHAIRCFMSYCILRPISIVTGEYYSCLAIQAAIDYRVNSLGARRSRDNYSLREDTRGGTTHAYI